MNGSIFCRIKAHYYACWYWQWIHQHETINRLHNRLSWSSCGSFFPVVLPTKQPKLSQVILFYFMSCWLNFWHFLTSSISCSFHCCNVVTRMFCLFFLQRVFKFVIHYSAFFQFISLLLITLYIVALLKELYIYFNIGLRTAYHMSSEFVGLNYNLFVLT